MNDLSWMIYFADVAGGIETAISGLIGFMVAGAAIAVIVGFMMHETSGTKETGKAVHKWIFKRLWYLLPLLVLVAVIPSQSTVYAIIASEAGEELAHTETANKALNAIDAWLDKQLDEGGAQ